MNPVMLLLRGRSAAPGLAAQVRGGAVAELAQRVFWAWALLAGALLFTGWWLQQRGVWQRLIDGDPSGISIVIVLLALVVTGWCGRRAGVLAQQARAGLGGDIDSATELALADGQPSWRATYAADLAAGQPQAAQLLSERTHGPHETAWWFTAATIKLGLLGTVVGFIIMSMQLGQSQSFELEQVQQLLRQMTSGMAIALYTTLVGLVANLFLGLQLLLLDRLADRIGAAILDSVTPPDAARES